jgi:hypothetical protein
MNMTVRPGVNGVPASPLVTVSVFLSADQVRTDGDPQPMERNHGPNLGSGSFRGLLKVMETEERSGLIPVAPLGGSIETT